MCLTDALRCFEIVSTLKPPAKIKGLAHEVEIDLEYEFYCADLLIKNFSLNLKCKKKNE